MLSKYFFLSSVLSLKFLKCLFVDCSGKSKISYSILLLAKLNDLTCAGLNGVAAGVLDSHGAEAGGRGGLARRGGGRGPRGRGGGHGGRGGARAGGGDADLVRPRPGPRVGQEGEAGLDFGQSGHWPLEQLFLQVDFDLVFTLACACWGSLADLDKGI